MRIATAIAIALGACAPEIDDTVDPWPYELPPGFPAPPVPANNAVTPAKVELGRHLFYDPRLSGNGTQSCASCHDPARAFTDGLALPLGSTGDVIPRNAMTLTNAGYWSTYTWMNPLLVTLEEQAAVPMFAEHPVELGMAGAMPTIVDRLERDPVYRVLFGSAFPEAPTAIDTPAIVAAIATFERTLISGRSAYDRYWYDGEVDALTAQEKVGMELFFGERAECYHCHAGALFTTAYVTEDQPLAEPSFSNTAVYNVGGTGAYPEPSTGLYAFTGLPDDMGKIRVPTLRNIDVTAPYFHDGSAQTLEEVVDHYARGGRTVAEGPAAGVGADSPFKHPLVRAFEITDDEKAALVAFLRALTDEEFLLDPRFADPWAP